jgi:diguanylate cyclase (GGDEF)-like protein
MGPRAEIDKDTIRQSDAASLVVSPEGRIVFLNIAAQALYGHHPGSLLPHQLPSEDDATVNLKGHRVQLNRKAVAWMGETAWLLTVTATRPLSTEPSTIAEFEVTCRQLQQENQHLRTLIHTDPLTGLLNRRGLSTRLRAEQSRLAREAGPITTLLIDLDDFKALNDAQGYDAGDRALSDVAGSMRRVLRSSDIIARIGGDEFLVLLPNTDTHLAEVVAERLRASIESAKNPVTASIGVMSLTPRQLDLQKIQVLLHSALSASKAHGKNQITHLHPTASTPSSQRFAFLRGLDGTPLAELCLLPPTGGLQSALLTLDACAHQPGTLPLHVPLSPELVLTQPSLLQHLPEGRSHVLALSVVSLSDKVMALREPLQQLRAAGIPLCLTGFTSHRRGLEAAVLLQPSSVILHPRQLASRSSGALERLCATLISLGCSVLADGIDKEIILEQARSAGIIGGRGTALDG